MTSTPTTCPRCDAPRADLDSPCAACLLRDAAVTPASSRAPAFEAPSPEALNAVLAEYEVQILLGQGGMGAVYRARHKKLDRLVAIKVLRPDGPTDDAAAFAERFEREARVLAKLDHPGIVRIHDFGRSAGERPFFYLVLEYVDGASLRELLRDGRLTAKDVLELVPQLCDALQSAHDVGVVHRDVKPENILVDERGRARIADFGLAKLLGEEEAPGLGLTRTSQVMGTPHYMAPEQIQGSRSVDHRADLYSLGVVLYELLTGELPVGRFAAPSKKSPDAKRADDVVMKALESDPDERYQAAREIEQDLTGESERAAAPERPVEPKRKSEDGATWSFGVLLLMCATLAVFELWFVLMLVFPLLFLRAARLKPRHPGHGTWLNVGIQSLIGGVAFGAVALASDGVAGIPLALIAITALAVSMLSFLMFRNDRQRARRRLEKRKRARMRRAQAPTPVMHRTAD